ncbi:MAG: hypothetical protein OER80_12790 [Gammaproteobacteria bacterium]|nr:hypothetical protein [Gammaproteobacteria bacterium]
MSKCIGETEKNLERMPVAVDDVNAILSFEEGAYLAVRRNRRRSRPLRP